jgi:hypothetical protein
LVYVALLGSAAASAAAAGQAVGASSSDVPTLVAAGSVLILAGLRWGATAGTAVALTLALPLYDVGWLELHGTLVGLFTVMLLVLLAATAANVNAANARRMLRTPLPPLLLLYAAIVGASLFLAEGTDVSRSLAKTYVARELLFPLVLGAALVTLGARAWPTMHRLVQALLCAGVVGSALALLQIVRLEGYLAPPGPSASAMAQFIGARAVGLAEAPGTWGSFMLLPFSYGLVALARRPSLWRGTLLAWLTAGLVLSGLRAAWLGAVVATCATLAVRVRSPRRLLAVVAAVVVGAAFPFTLGNFRLFLKGGGADTIQRIEHGGAPAAAGSATTPYAASVELDKQSVSIGKGRLAVDESARYRKVLSRAELDLGIHHPLTGVGLGNIGPALVDLRPSYVVDHPETGVIPGVVVDKQNTYAGLFAELGAPGILAFLAIGFAALRSVQRVRKRIDDPLPDGTLVALVATAVVAAFWDSDRQVFLWWLVGIAIALETLTRYRAVPAGVDARPRA